MYLLTSYSVQTAQSATSLPYCILLYSFPFPRILKYNSFSLYFSDRTSLQILRLGYSSTIEIGY